MARRPGRYVKTRYRPTRTFHDLPGRKRARIERANQAIRNHPRVCAELRALYNAGPAPSGTA